jgi:pimeloyl-ACP methyl ester carboxylesterase
MTERSVVKVNGVELSVLDQGTGPLVVLLHGFPEGAYSWRHQIEPLVAAGYRVIAPDQRGYGDSSHPDSIDQYSIMHLVGDIVGLIASAGEKTATVIGHDWGAMVAWNVAAMRPDIVRGVVGLSVPPVPRGDIPPLRQMLADYDGRFYVNYFDRVGPVDDELNRDVPASLRKFFHLLSGDNPINDTARPILIPAGGGVLDGHEDRLPSWLSEAELDNFVRQFEGHGFTGGLNWYRNLNRNWELTAPFEGASFAMPAQYVCGARDTVKSFHGLMDYVTSLASTDPNFREPVTLPECGHWIQQERPAETTAILLDFLRSLD